MITKLSEMALEEAHGACKYAKLAVKYKTEKPSIADALYRISTEELNHMALLNGEAAKELEHCKAEDPDGAAMLEILYDYIREQEIDVANKAKIFQNQYKGI